jgi:FkbH-like protein/FkbM family methyltransferase
MRVVPGSFYVDLALTLHAQRFGITSAHARHVAFHNPIVLGSGDTHVHVAIAERGPFVEYAFHEPGSALGAAAAGRVAARLDMHDSGCSSHKSLTAGWAEPLTRGSGDLVDAHDLYRRLTANGNGYGPHFQNLSSIRRDRSRATAEVIVDRQRDPRARRVLVLDAAIHLLSVFAYDSGQPFLLHSVQCIDVEQQPCPERLWAHAECLAFDRPGGAFVGRVRVVGSDNREYAVLSGVRLQFLAPTAPPRPRTSMHFAATFTAEPVADSLAFWADQCDLPIDLAFSRSKQIFQQLLDPASGFHRNRSGVNVILLGLESWIDAPVSLSALSRDRAQECFGDRPRYILPSGLEIVHLKDYETKYLYEEIFETQSYIQHGIRLDDDARVIDIGANIGLFSLFVLSQCARPRILAFEPSPVVFDVLRANCDAYGPDVQAFNLGVGERSGSATFTFYENSSVFSGFHADPTEDAETLETIFRRTLGGAEASSATTDAYIRSLTAERLRARTYSCQITTVSDIIRANHLETIDLLKIDAEKSELEILAGIDANDWPRIEQLVIEVHDRTGNKIREVERVLVAHGYDCAIDEAPSLAQSGLVTVYATRSGREEALGTNPPAGDGHPVPSIIQRRIEEFGDALRAFMRRSTVPLIVCFCPATPAARWRPARVAGLEAAERRLVGDLATIPGIHTIGSESLLTRYRLADYADQDTRQLGDMPYSSSGYAAIGTSVFRRLVGLTQQPYKVIVLDCDNTLWKGVCGEDGALGVDITPQHRALQNFMVGQAAAGRMLCLCSQNNERDVLDVFTRRTDMALTLSHFVSYRINWNSKSANILSLSRELNLGLDSFIFIDDDAVHCADVEANCPGALALQLPQDPDGIDAFLNHTWAFDRAVSTHEDRERSRMYRENSARDTNRTLLSLKDFIESLELRVTTAPPADADLGRISQLTFRTNQFNFTSIRRSETDVRTFLAGNHGGGLVARVSDRFGDYGLVGVVLYESDGDRYSVDTFLLSCRALGRGVEHRITAAIGQQAAAGGKRLVEFRYVPTAANAPAAAFLQGLAHLRQQPSSTSSWVFAAEDLMGLTYQPDESRAAKEQAADHPAEVRVVPDAVRTSRPTALQRHISTDLADITRITQAIERHRLRVVEADSLTVAAAPLESAILTIWQKALARSRVGLNDNFFEVGGTSVLAVQVIAAIRKALKYELSVIDLFEYPTVALLAAKCRAASGPDDESASEAVRRGQQRRSRLVKTRRS